MGKVFLAEDPVLERPVALKLLHRDPRDASLRDEAKALAALRHPGIVTVFEIGEHEGSEFIAMEYVPGQTLRELLTAGAPRERLVAICAKVAAAVAAAHAAGILHRDIKPENILVDGDDVKVLDFGIARRLDTPAPPSQRATATELLASLTTTLPVALGTATEVSAGTDTAFGTPAYMPLEVMSGEPWTEASDVYSLGVVLYECLTGARPYAGANLIELIAQMVDGAVPAIDDPLGDVVAAMLAREPSARPTLADVVTRLSPKIRLRTAPSANPPRRSRLAWIVGSSVVTLAIAAIVIAAIAISRHPTKAAPAVATARVHAKLAIAPLEVKTSRYGVEGVATRALADALSSRLATAVGAEIECIAVDSTSASRAAEAGADFILRGTIADAGDRMRVHGAVVRTTTGARIGEIDTNTGPRIADVVDGLADAVLEKLAPAAHLDHTPNRMAAMKLYEEGKRSLDQDDFRTATTVLEQAVHADPAFFPAWYALALSSGWQEADESFVTDAAEHAVELAPTPFAKRFMQGVKLFFEGEFPAARDALEPLATKLDDPTYGRELAYYLGEANWHDGRLDVGFEYLKRACDSDPLHEFLPPRIHVVDYLIVRRDPDAGRYIGGRDYDALEFALGHYARLAEHAPAGIRVPAMLVLDREVSAESLDTAYGHTIDRKTIDVALALAAGDRAKAKRAFAEAWARLTRAPLKSSAYATVENLGEVVIAGELRDETNQLIRLLSTSQPWRGRRAYRRLATLAAGMQGDASLIVREGATYRERRVADAIAAELAGDRESAVTTMHAIVADPSANFDYPERAALLRELLAVKRTDDAKQLCEDTARPPRFRFAFLVVRGACRRAHLIP